MNTDKEVDCRFSCTKASGSFKWSLLQLATLLILSIFIFLPVSAQQGSEGFSNPAATCGSGAPVRAQGSTCHLCGDRPSCLICPTCGDGCQTVGEGCDDGNTDESDGCRNCRLPRCGDGYSNSNDFTSHRETCEATYANGTTDPACRANCTKCGDSIVNAEEECDAGPNGNSVCAPNCRTAGCGNGFLEPHLGETCDTDIPVGDPGYAPGCRPKGEKCTYCGDGHVQEDAFEVCDGEEHCSYNCLGFDPYCGDGIVQEELGEECDDGDQNESNGCRECKFPTCGDGYKNQFDDPSETCEPSQNPTCRDNCTRCGDGIINHEVEECDGEDLGNITDPDASCSASCQLNSYCGDGNKDEGEECDDGDQNESNGCRECRLPSCGDGYNNRHDPPSETCEPYYTRLGIEDEDCRDEDPGRCTMCGDGIINGGEECDNEDLGNITHPDAVCSASCQLNSYCGDGNRDEDRGEECDGEENCTVDCQLVEPTCGDGVIQEGEQCDGSDLGDNTGSDVSCNDTCRLNPYCGDSQINQANEVCDGADFGQLPGKNQGVTLECNASCQIVGPYCGDGLISGAEQCDGTNLGEVTDPHASCRYDCTFLNPVCGDSEINQEDEACDGTDLGQLPGKNQGVTLECNANCEIVGPYCGDGIINGEEQCDGTNLGNITDPDASCKYDCTLNPYCGDRIRQDGEACDDGNQNNVDGCTVDCREENICEDIQPIANEAGRTYEHGDTDGEGTDSTRVFVCVRGSFTFSQHEHAWVNVTDASDGTYYSTRGEWRHNGERIDDDIVGNVLNRSHGNPFLDNDLVQDLFEEHGNNNRDSPFVLGLLRTDGTESLVGGTSDANQYTVHSNDLSEICWTCAWVRVVGCFAPETTILLANGEEKAIKDIRKGDFVWNPVTEKSVEVDFVMESSEAEPLIEILTINGKSLKVTQKHPIKTKSGLKTAADLKVGDFVEVANDFEQIVSVENLEVKNSQTVYNLMLKADSDDLDDHMVLADGVVAGDQYAQDQLEK